MQELLAGRIGNWLRFGFIGGLWLLPIGVRHAAEPIGVLLRSRWSALDLRFHGAPVGCYFLFPPFGTPSCFAVLSFRVCKGKGTGNDGPNPPPPLVPHPERRRGGRRNRHGSKRHVSDSGSSSAGSDRKDKENDGRKRGRGSGKRRSRGSGSASGAGDDGASSEAGSSRRPSTPRRPLTPNRGSQQLQMANSTFLVRPITDKNTERGSNRRFRYGFADMQGAARGTRFAGAASAGVWRWFCLAFQPPSPFLVCCLMFVVSTNGWFGLRCWRRMPFSCDLVNTNPPPLL